MLTEVFDEVGRVRLGIVCHYKARAGVLRNLSAQKGPWLNRYPYSKGQQSELDSEKIGLEGRRCIVSRWLTLVADHIYLFPMCQMVPAWPQQQVPANTRPSFT
jgi:hypothetical protein